MPTPLTPAPRQVVERLLAAVTGRRPADAAALYADDAVVTHPFAPPGGSHGAPLVGRAALAEHFAAGAAVPREMHAHDVLIHQTVDPEVVVAEFTYRGRATETGRAFAVPCVFVVRVRDGLIVESRDYAHHAAMAQALRDASPDTG